MLNVAYWHGFYVEEHLNELSQHHHSGLNSHVARMECRPMLDFTPDGIDSEAYVHSCLESIYGRLDIAHA